MLVLEIDVRLPEANRLEGRILCLSNASKFVPYFSLLLVPIDWGFKMDSVDFRDASRWLVAVVFIELNVFEWRQQSLEQPASDAHIA